MGDLQDQGRRDSCGCTEYMLAVNHRTGVKGTQPTMTPCSFHIKKVCFARI